MATSPAESGALPSGRSNAMAWWSAGTIFLSAFLLFQVQPIISKKILPWFGGSPAVWTTCVLFFQMALLGGYAYSHWIINRVSIRRQGVIHATLLGLALLTLPFFPPWDWWKPADGNYPAMRIMLLLLFVVGSTYFLLSTTGPLVQAWFARLYPGRSPYRLYALSNVGSLLALLSYPFLFETMLYVDTQGRLWSLGFVVFAILIGIMARTMWREAQADVVAEPVPRPAANSTQPAAKSTRPAKPGDKPSAPEAPVDGPPSAWLRLGWLALAATATMTLLAFTNHLCQDIAVVPFMWVIPLSLYLLTFIITFEYERFYFRTFFGVLTLLSILWLTAMLNFTAVDEALEKPQRFVAAALWQPKLDTQQEKDDYAKKNFGEKMEVAKPLVYSPFSRPMNWTFARVDWLDQVVQNTFSKEIGDENRKRYAEWQKNEYAEWKKQYAEWKNEKKDDPQMVTKAAPAKPAQPTYRDDDWIPFDCSCGDFTDHVVAITTSFMVVLFLICLVCHGELVKSKPKPQYLTSFYLFISLGGALGGLFVALICPMIFKSHFELALSMIGGFIVAWMAIFNAGRQGMLKSRELMQWLFAFVVVGTTLLVAKGNIDGVEPSRWLSILPKWFSDKIVAWKIVPEPNDKVIGRDRNFYGTVFVEKLGDWDDPSNSGLALYNGRIWHGFQYQDPARQLEPTTYYVEGTGAALAVTEHPKRLKGESLKVGVIGLGTGSMAAHGKAGDKFYFYDIDPKIEDFAKKYFTYLKDSPAKPEVILGDARIMMERQEDQNYDVIVLDAFSGDAIPAHLLTKEAFALYERHLHKDADGKPDGVIVIHISNRYIALEPVVAAIAEEYKYETIEVNAPGDDTFAGTASDWVLVSKNRDFLSNPTVASAGKRLDPPKRVLWTDQFTALFPLLK